MRFAPLVALLLLAACHGNLPTQPAPKPAPDPCAQPAASRYYIRVASKNFSGDHFITCDTTYPGNVRFSAPRLYTSVAWRIGHDPRTFTQNPQPLDFQQAIGTIVVRFIGSRPVDKCRPGDKGVDTLFTTLTVVPFNLLPYHLGRHKAAIEGTFLGATDAAPQDTFRVSIHPGLNFLSDSGSISLIPFNLSKGCLGLEMEAVPQYRSVEFNQSRNLGPCHGVYGYAALDSLDRNQLRIVYQEQVAGQYTKRIFVGTRQR